MSTTDPPDLVTHDELEQMVREYRHLREEYSRAGPESRNRRHLDARIAHLRHRFERAVQHGIAEEPDRTYWRDRFHAHGPLGEATSAAGTESQRLFLGESAAGQRLELRGVHAGPYELIVDGVPVGSTPVRHELTSTAPLELSEGGRLFREVFDTDAGAVEALEAYLEGSAELSAESAAALLADGIVDRQLGLTPRGRRLLELHRSTSASPE